MAKTIVQGRQFLLSLGGGKVGCATSISTSINIEEVEAACRESGDWADFELGMSSMTIDVEGLYIIDDPAVADNQRASDFAQAAYDKTILPFVLGPGQNSDGVLGEPGDLAGSLVWSGNLAILSYSETGTDGNMTYSASMKVKGRPTYAAAPPAV
jgi:hypothetical protein